MLKRRQWRELHDRLSMRPQPLDDDERLHAILAGAALGIAPVVTDEITPLLGDPERRLFVRRLGVSEALQKGRVADAVAFARALVAVDPESAEDSALLVRSLRQAGQVAESDAEFMRLSGATSDTRILTRRMMLMMREDKAAEAVQIAHDNLAACVDDARFAQTALTACERIDDTETTARIIDVLRDRPMTADLLAVVHRALLRLNRPMESLELCRAMLEKAPSARLHLAVVESMRATNAPTDGILPHLSKALEMEPDAPYAWTISGQVLLALGKYPSAAKALERAVALAPSNRNVRSLFIRALRHSGQYEQAAAEVDNYMRDFGRSSQFSKIATGVLLLSGREADAARIYAQDIEERGQKFGSRNFAEHLEFLKREENLPKLPRARLDWAWNLSKRVLGHDPSPDRADWERRARWGNAVDVAILDWIECYPSRLSEVQSLLNTPVEQMQRAHDYLKTNRGLLFASAHVGPMYAGPLAMYGYGLPFRVVTSVPRVSTARFSENMISTIDVGEVYVLRKILSTIEEGKIAIIAVDGAMNPATPRIIWEGAQVTYSPIVPALCLRLKLPSVFAQPYWKDGRISVMVEFLPTAEPDEPNEQFFARWQAAYFGYIRQFFALGPENLRLSGGFWRDISPFEAEKLAQD